MGKAFEPFFPAKDEGIGLWVRRSTIDAHHEWLWKKPNNGPGATSSFAIPCAPEGLARAETRVDRNDGARDAG